MSSLPSEGSLAETPVPKLLLELYLDRYTGALSLELQRQHKKLLLDDGAPVAVESDLASESLCAQLMAEGRISEQDAKRVDQAMASKGHPEGSALVALGLLQPRELFEALKDQVARRTLACFSWSEGRYSLNHQEIPAENLRSFRADPITLVQTGLESAWGVDRMLEALAPRMDKFPVATRSLNTAIDRLDTDEATQTVLSQLNGTISLGQVLGGAVRSPRALAAAWVIDASGLVRYEDTAVEAESQQAPRVVIELAEVEVQRGARPAAGAAQGRPIHGRDDSDRVEEMRAEILAREERLAELDLYELLELERDAAAGLIKKAYIHAAKRYHPDSLARLGLESLKQQAAAVFSRIAEAYEVLSDPQKRAYYDSGDSEAPEIDTEKLAQAETLYRKGEILVRMGDFRGALQFLEGAVDLWPEEPVYQAALGWTLYKKNPPEPERAQQHLDQALTQAPDDAMTNFRVSVVLRELGQVQEADKALAYARSLDPNVAES